MKLVFSAASRWDSRNCPHTDNAWERSQLFTAQKCKWVVFKLVIHGWRLVKYIYISLPQFSSECDTRKSAIKRDAGGRWGWLVTGCALSIGPFFSPDPCYCGDSGLLVTDGCWGVSAVVKSTKCVNHSHRYKELKGYTRGQKKPQQVQYSWYSLKAFNN